MVDRKDPLPVTRQCALLDLPRSTFYHVPKPVSEEELEQMALIDRCHLKHPFYGSRRIRDWLEDHGYRVNRKKLQRLRSPESGVGNGYHVYPDGPGLCVPSRDHGLVLAQGTVVACIQHARHQLLCRCSGGSYRGLWCAGDIQHRPGQPVHQ